MFGFLGLFRLMFFIYLAIAILVVGAGYNYADRYFPNLDLPYKERVIKLQAIVLEYVDAFIENHESSNNKLDNPFNKLGK